MTDYRRSGYVSAYEGDQWLQQWAKKLVPETVCLFGGEPLMNPDLYKWIEIVRKFWPNSTIKVITNGLLFRKKLDIFQEMYRVRPSILQTSLHFKDNKHRPAIKQSIADNLKKLSLPFKPATSTAPHEQQIFKHNGFTVILAEFGEFVKPYKGQGKTMQPYETKNINDSYRICGSPQNPILYKNKLYKCGPIANLKDTLMLFDLDESPAWQKYLKYTGYSADDDITTLLENFSKPEWICSMCPSSTKDLVDHYEKDAVRFK